MLLAAYLYFFSSKCFKYVLYSFIVDKKPFSYSLISIFIQIKIRWNGIEESNYHKKSRMKVSLINYLHMSYNFGA